MANLEESSIYDSGVYQLEITDPVIGGPNGISNTPLKQLASRTKWLKDNKQASDATLTALAALTTAADKMIYATGSDAFATTTLTAFARTLLDDVDAATMRATLGAQASGSYQASDATLTALAALTTAADKMIYATGSDAFATTTLTAFSRTLLDDVDAATMRATLGAQASGSYQASDATLTALAALTTAADKMIYATAADTFATTTLTAFARTLLDDADAATMRATLGALGSLSANDSNVKTALNASGTAPIYACRAWVNFNGVGTVAIKGSGNISSVTDNGVGNYTVNFTTAMPDADFSVQCQAQTFTVNSSTFAWLRTNNTSSLSASNVTISTGLASLPGVKVEILQDMEVVCVSIFR